MSISLEDCKRYRAQYPGAVGVSFGGVPVYESQRIGDWYVPGEDNQARVRRGEVRPQDLPHAIHTSNVVLLDACGQPQPRPTPLAQQPAAGAGSPLASNPEISGLGAFIQQHPVLTLGAMMLALLLARGRF